VEVIAVDSKYYDEAFKKPYHIFNTGAFNALNHYKCEEVFYLVFKDSKVRLGIILGLRNGILNSPFSAPFGGFQFVNEDVGLNQIDAALVALEQWALQNKFKGIKVVLPPLFYNANFITKLTSCLYRANFQQMNLDINYQFPTHKFNENYLSTIWYNARKNLKRGVNANLTFEN